MNKQSKALRELLDEDQNEASAVELAEEIAGSLGVDMSDEIQEDCLSWHFYFNDEEEDETNIKKAAQLFSEKIKYQYPKVKVSLFHDGCSVKLE